MIANTTVFFNFFNRMFTNRSIEAIAERNLVDCRMLEISDDLMTLHKTFSNSFLHVCVWIPAYRLKGLFALKDFCYV